MCGVAVERERYACNVLHCIAQLLRRRELKREECRDDALVEPCNACKPWDEVVDGRPQEHRYNHARDTFFVELLGSLLYWQEQQSGYHGKQRYTWTHERADEGSPKTVQRVGLGCGIVYVDAVCGDNHQHSCKTECIDPVEALSLLVH